MLDALADVAAALGRSATPADAFVPAGDGGTNVAVATHPGQALRAAPIFVGRTAAAVDPGAANVRLNFEGGFVAPCKFVNDAGNEETKPCGAGLVSAKATFFEASTAGKEGRCCWGQYVCRGRTEKQEPALQSAHECKPI